MAIVPGMEDIDLRQIGFRTVARILRDQILDGTYPPGASLPSEAKLCKDFRCSRDTVRDAMETLAVEGHVLRRRGHLTIVRPTPTRIPLELPPAARVTARPMSLDESDELGCGQGIALFEVRTGGECTLYRSDQYVLTTAPTGTIRRW
jgi:DNA-binding transcriptional MocR family regulator